MQNLYFVRHGQTHLNATDHVQGGDIDSPLLEKSIEDARKTGLFLKNTAISRAITSPQLRAHNTAIYILSAFENDIPLETDSRLKEFRYGSWEGLHIPTLAEKYPETFRHLREEPDKYNPVQFGGETYPELIKRGTESVLYHANRYPNEDLLFVGHSILWTATLLSLLNFEIKDIRSQSPLGNTSISKLVKLDNTIKLDTWNYLEHLR